MGGGEELKQRDHGLIIQPVPRVAETLEGLGVCGGNAELRANEIASKWLARLVPEDADSSLEATAVCIHPWFFQRGT